MLRSIGKQSGESVESVPKKEKKATVGRTRRIEARSCRPFAALIFAQFTLRVSDTVPCFHLN